jgi:hypothetical protein
MTADIDSKSSFGLFPDNSGAHMARTIMLEDLDSLFRQVPDPLAPKSDYVEAIVTENCLGKKCGQSRKLALRHLVMLYGLEPSITIFRALRYFWDRDEKGRPLTTLLCAYARDSLIRCSAKLVLPLNVGDQLTVETIEDFLQHEFPGRFSKGALNSTARNLKASWTKSGHLSGRGKKFRVRAVASSGSVSYALLLGYLSGLRGKSLFESEFMKLLDCPIGEAMEMADTSARNGWIIFKRLGDVVEVLFPAILTQTEMELACEQGQKTA